MMIQLAEIHNGFHNKNHLNNIDIADIGNMDNNMGNTEVAGGYMKAAGEYMKVVGEYMKVVGEYTEAAGEYTEAAGEYTENIEVVDNRQLAVLQQHW